MTIAILLEELLREREALHYTYTALDLPRRLAFVVFMLPSSVRNTENARDTQEYCESCMPAKRQNPHNLRETLEKRRFACK